MSETLYQTWLRSREEALERCFDKHSWQALINPDAAWLYCTIAAQPQISFGRLTVTRYGMFKLYTREDLNGRKFEIEFLDGKPSLYFTDVWHDPRSYSCYPRWLGGPPTHRAS